VGPGDIFPEEFATFLGVGGEVRREFVRRHGDLFQAEWWSSVQKRVAAGELIEIYPYEERLRLGVG
jgi:isocitrate dehydrogenase kinase/phosphatase